jgi:arylsulfatase A-like enzyme
MLRLTSLSPTPWRFRVCLCVVSISLSSASSAWAGDPRPNIILFLTDDQGWNGTSVQMDPSVPGSQSDYYQTPNLEALAARGMRFSRAYSAAPLCQPTRASIQTGMSPAQLQYTDNFEAASLTQARFSAIYNGFPLTPPIPAGLPADGTTIARWLNQNRPEYAAAHIGKWHVNRSPTDMGYEVGLDTFGNDQTNDPWAIFALTDLAVNFMQNRVQSAEPFLLQLSHRAVHTPIRARPESIAAFEQIPGGAVHADPNFAAMTYDLDASLGAVLDAVRELGIEDNTYIIYMSDNGSFRSESLPTPLGGGKNTLHEGGIRVPLVVAGPGIQPGSVSRVPVISTDLLSTISELAGIDAPLPDAVEGTSFAPVLHNGGQLPQGTANLVRDFGPRGELFFHSPHNFGASSSFRVVPMSAVVLDNWKLIKIWGENGAPDALYLTNLDEGITEPLLVDPGSSLNRARQFPEIAADLDAALMRWLEGVDASLPYDVKKPVALVWDAGQPGANADSWRSTTNADYVLRERWTLGSGVTQPQLVATDPHQPGLARQAFSFDGVDRMTRKYFHVSDLIGRRHTPNSGTPDLDRSATFEFWIRFDSLTSQQILFESGNAYQGLSITLGDGDGDGVHDEVRLRALGDNGQHLTTTATLNEFANPTRDFVHLVAVLNDANDNRFAELFVNGASLARTDGVLGPDGSIRWDTYDAAGLGGVGGSSLGAALGGGDGAFFLGGLRGDVAEMRFFNRAVAPDDVLAHYNAALDAADLGIMGTSGAAAAAAWRPSDVSEGALEADSQFLVIQERTDVLDSSLALDLAAPSLGAETLAAGTEFTSYLVHFDPVDDPSQARAVAGEITFASPILGVLLEPDSLAATDATLGAIGRYDVGSHHEGAFVDLAPDGYTATIVLSAAGSQVSQVRILTEPAFALPGDFNGDLQVDQGDLDLLLVNFGIDGTIPPSGWTTNRPGGLIGQAQLDAVLLNWGQSRFAGTAASTAIPEPSGIFLALLLWLAGLLNAARAKQRSARVCWGPSGPRANGLPPRRGPGGLVRRVPFALRSARRAQRAPSQTSP